MTELLRDLQTDPMANFQSLPQVSSVEVRPTLTTSQEVAQENKEPSLMSLVPDAVESQWMSSYLVNHIGASSYMPNENWSGEPSADERKLLKFDTRPKELVEEIITESVSFDHAKAMAARQDERLAAEQRLGNAGIPGLAVAFAVGFADPAAFALSAVTEGTLAPFIWAQKTSRMARIARSGFLSGVSSAAVEGTIAYNDPLTDSKDVFMQTLYGIGWGSAFGAMGRSRPAHPLASELDAARQKMVNDMEVGLTVEAAEAAGIPRTSKAAPTGENNTTIILDADDMPQIVRSSDVEPPATVDPVTSLPRTREEIAAELNPGLHKEVTELNTRKETFTRWIDELKATRLAAVEKDATVRDLQRKLKNAGARRRPEFEEQIAARKAELMAQDSPDQVKVRKDLQDVDYRLRDLAVDMSTVRKRVDEVLQAEKLKRVPMKEPVADVPALMKTDLKVEAAAAAAVPTPKTVEAPEAAVAARMEREEAIGKDPVILDAALKMQTAKTPEERTAAEAQFNVRREEMLAATPEPAKIEGNAGAAQAAFFNPMVSSNVEKMSSVWKAGRVAARDVFGQIDAYAKVARSKHAGLSWFVDKLVTNGGGDRRRTGRIQGRTVEEDKAQISNQLQTEVQMPYDTAYNVWAKENERRFASLNIDARREFGVLVGEYRGGEFRDPHAHPSIVKAAAAHDVFYRKFAALAKEHGIKGFDEIEPNDRYMMRIVNSANMERLERRIGTMSLVKMFAGAIQRAPGRDIKVSGDKADRMAYLYVKWLKHSAVETNRGMTPAFNSALIARLRENLEISIAKKQIDLDDVIEAGGDTAQNKADLEALLAKIDQNDINDLVDSVKNVGQAGVIGRGKFRLGLDEGYTSTINGESVSLSQVFERDAERLMQKYAAEMSGAVALARHPDLQIKSMSDWETYMNNFEQTRPSFMDDQEKFAGQMRVVELFRRHIFGQPLSDDLSPDWATGFRLMQKFNYIRLGGQFAFSQISEFSGIVGGIGFRVGMQHMPMVAKIVRDAKTGKFDDEFADELFSMGHGVESLLNHPSARDLEAAAPTSRMLAKAEDVANISARVMSTASLLGPLTDSMRRVAAAAVVQKLSNLALGKGGTISPQRLMALGLDKPRADRLFAEFQRPDVVVYVDSLWGNKKVARLNIEQWSAEAREILSTAVWRWSSQAIQRNDIGSLPAFMSKPLAQMLFQFRTFSLGAWSKQLMHGVNMRDAQAAQSVMWATMLAGVMYTARTTVMSIGRDDRDEYLEKNLDPMKIGKMAFARSGYASVVPGVIDSVFEGLGFEEQFSNSRTTGQKQNFVQGSPAFTALEAGGTLLTGTSKAIRMSNYNWSQKEGRALKQLTPGGTVPGFSNMLDMLISELPERSSYK